MSTTNIPLRLFLTNNIRSSCHLCGRIKSKTDLRHLKKVFYCTAQSQPKTDVMTMKAWQIHQYGGNEQLTFSNTVRIPKINNPSDILVKVCAASVNPIDFRMRDGYGKVGINVLRQKSSPYKCKSEFPLVLGRDFSGVVVETGQNVKKYKPGDEVWGALSADRQGTHAEFTLTSRSEISLKPKTLSHTEAASIPYVATTTWAALCTIGELSENNTRNKRILIHGGSGGIGTFAIQLMKAWGAEVTTICSTDAVDLLYSLGADVVIDYKTQDVKEELEKIKGFDIIYDTLGKVKAGYSEKYLKSWRNSKYITIVHPLLSNLDTSGVPFGIMKTAVDIGSTVMKGFQSGNSHRWAIFLPNGRALGKISHLVDNEQIKPIIDQVIPFEELPAAYEKVSGLHGRGKTVISMM